MKAAFVIAKMRRLLLSTLVVVILVFESHYLLAQTTKSEFTYTLDDGYPMGERLFGNIAGVDVDRTGNVIIFHRGSHRWGPTTFDANDVYNKPADPIPEQTVVTIDPNERKVIRAWGHDMFYMPHGLSLDLSGNNLWLTDVAMHQVFKYSTDGTKLIELGTPFIPGSDEAHFCKPTSVADTGEFIFVADGYCNSRVAMFSAKGVYLGEFGQSSDGYLSNPTSIQPYFNIPHKITYAKEARMLCVADRENGRIQCFSFEPKRKKDLSSDEKETEETVILNGAIKPKFIIADPLFNGRLFALDYSPIRGGIIVAISGEDLSNPKRTPLGFVYNVTTQQLISRFAPPAGRTFGMAHDLAITGTEAQSLYVVDVSPVNLWRFSRPEVKTSYSETLEIGLLGPSKISGALSTLSAKNHRISAIWYIIIFTVVGSLLFVVSRTRKNVRYSSSNSFASLYSNGYPASINSLFGRGASRFPRRANGNGSSDTLFSTMFSRRAFFSLFDRNRQQQNEFNRIPMEESDNSDDDKSDSDVEEFNINQASPNVKIDV